MKAFRIAAGVLAALTMLATAGQGVQGPKDQKAEKPDVIVSDLDLAGTDIVLEIQNQGPGVAKKGATIEAVLSGSTTTKVKDKATGKDKFMSTPVSVTVTVPVPAVLALEKVKVPLEKFGVKNGVTLSQIVTVTLDPKKTLDEERTNNNVFHRQLDFVGNVVKPKRAGYEGGTELPDLIVTDIIHDGPYLKVKYINAGKGATGADFMFQWRCGKHMYGGNSYYRYQVPEPGKEETSGGLTMGLIGLSPGVEVEVEVTVDYEDRVRESDKKNNTFKKTVVIPKAKK